MARCQSKGFNRFSGRVGNVIFYKMRGEFYARASPTEVRDCRSELQLYYRERMRGTAMFYGVVRQTLLALVWQAVGRRKNRSAYNLFVQANIRAFNGAALLYNLVRFSSGSLALPGDLQAYRDGSKIRLTWKNEEVVSDERLGDELWCVVMTEDKNFRIIEPRETGGIREDEAAEIEIVGEEGGKVHLYCFFGTMGRDDFSENVHFTL
jgi:hypothetical protein